MQHLQYFSLFSDSSWSKSCSTNLEFMLNCPRGVLVDLSAPLPTFVDADSGPSLRRGPSITI
eukprot:4104823-Amphidinium_carterae.1